MVEHQSHYLLINGMLLFILGLLNGLVIPFFKNKRMGLAAHLAGVQSGMVLLLFELLVGTPLAVRNSSLHKLLVKPLGYLYKL